MTRMAAVRERATQPENARASRDSDARRLQPTAASAERPALMAIAAIKPAAQPAWLAMWLVWKASARRFHPVRHAVVERRALAMELPVPVVAAATTTAPVSFQLAYAA